MSGELPSGRPPGGGKKEIDLGGVASGISPRNKSPRSVSPRKSSPRKKKGPFLSSPLSLLFFLPLSY